VEQIPPVNVTVSVARSVDEAFKIWTEGIAGWWPLEKHSIGGARVTGAVFEPMEGGRVFEVWDDGSEHDWAMITTYDPPNRVVLAWRPSSEPSPTEVDVRFIAEGTGTRVELEHRGWELLGEEGREARDNYNGGWPTTMRLYGEAAA